MIAVDVMESLEGPSNIRSSGALTHTEHNLLWRTPNLEDEDNLMMQF